MQLAGQLYPGHAVLVLRLGQHANTTSHLAAAVHATGSAAVVVLLLPGSDGNAAAAPLHVDRAISVAAGQKLVIATAAALQAAAAAGSIQPLTASLLLPVTCQHALDGGFVHARGAASLELLGLAIRVCPGVAVDASDMTRLLLQDVELHGHNSRHKAAAGAAIVADSVRQVVLQRVACTSNTAVAAGACVAAKKLQHLNISNSIFVNNIELPQAGSDNDAAAFSGGVVSALHVAELTVTGSSFVNNSARIVGGAIKALNSGKVVVSGCSFRDNQAPAQGAALFAGDVASLVVAHSSFNRNGGWLPSSPDAGDGRLVFMGGAIFAEGSRVTADRPVNLLITNCTFANNVADNAAAVAVQQWGQAASRIEVQGCSFVNNVATFEAGALFVDEAKLNRVAVADCLFQGNAAKYAGAASVYDSQTTLHNSTFAHNKAEVDGGALYFSTMTGAASHTKATLAGCSLVGNSAGTVGGAVLVDGQALMMADCVVSGNQAAEKGGGIMLLSAPIVELHRVRLLHNAALGGSGGGLAAEGVQQHLILHGVLMQHNKAVSGGGAFLANVNNASLTAVQVLDNSASEAAGGLAVWRSQQLVLAASHVLGNRASVAGGVAVDSVAQLTFSGADFQGNAAVMSSRGAEALVSFASNVQLAGTAGAVLVQKSAAVLQHCSFTSNWAAGAAGALLVEQPLQQLVITATTFSSNNASGSDAGALLVRAGQAANVSLQATVFRVNTAPSGRGGALMLDSRLGQLNISCHQCAFSSNAAAAGAAVAASGPLSFACDACLSDHNTAARSGGLLDAIGCDSLQLTGSSSSNDSAGDAGGSVSCHSPGMLAVSGTTFANCSAGAGGAVAVQGGGSVTVTGSRFNGNTASTQPPQQLATTPGTRLPGAWLSLFGAQATSASGVQCSSGGAGGGLCLSGVRDVLLSSASLLGNTGSIGGGMAVSTACAGSAADGSNSPSAANCAVRLMHLAAANNTASAAGSMLFTSTPQTLQLDDANQQARDSLERQQQQQDSWPRGCCSGFASLPTNASLVAAASQAQPEPIPQQQLQQPPSPWAGRRMLLRFEPVSPIGSFRPLSAAASAARFGVPHEGAHEEAGASYLPARCPPLGATVLSGDSLELDSQQVVSLPVHLLDAFGSVVRGGPGSDWSVSLTLVQQQGNSASYLTSAHAQLQAGEVVMRGLALVSSPGRQETLSLQAAPAGGTPPGQAVSSDIRVRVRPCLAGQAAVVSIDAPTRCLQCAAPTLSFSAYGAAAPGSSEPVGSGSCFSCPRHGICVAGMVVPAQGCWQHHPRTYQILGCPHAAACTRTVPAMQLMQGMQCANRRHMNATSITDADVGLFRALQCARGYSGPLCSSCFRPGRQRMRQQQRQERWQQQLLDSLGSPTALAAASSAVYGQANRRCRQCPHMAAAWVAFLSSRLVDLLLVLAMALLWLTLGWLSGCAVPASAFGRLKSKHAWQLGFAETLLPLRTGSFSTCEALGSVGSTPQPAAQGSQRAVLHLEAGCSSCLHLQHSSSHGRGSTSSSCDRQPSGRRPRQGCPNVAAGGGSLPAGMGSGWLANTESADIASPFEIAAVSNGGSFKLQASVCPEADLPSVAVRARSIQHSEGLSASRRTVKDVAATGALMDDDDDKEDDEGYGADTLSPLRVWSRRVRGSFHDASFNASEGEAAVFISLIRYVAYFAQVMLDGLQIAAVLLSQDLTWRLPGWAATTVSALLVTQANTLEWVPLECLMPSSSPVSGAAVQTALVMLLPGLYTALLLPVLCRLRSLTYHAARSSSTQQLPAAAQPPGSPTGATAGVVVMRSPGDGRLGRLPSSSDGSNSALYRLREAISWGSPAQTAGQQACRDTGTCMWWQPGPLAQHTQVLLTALVVSSMAYTFTAFCGTLVTAFDCMRLVAPPSIPGEIDLAGDRRWLPDMQLQCLSPQHIVAVVAAALVGLPALLGYLLLLLALAWPEAGVAAGPPRCEAAQSGAHRLLQLRTHGALQQVERLVLSMQRRLFVSSGITGVKCAGMGVWNMQQRWWWPLCKELMKLVMAITAAMCALRGPQVQALMLLLLVALAAAASWHAIPGCCITMERVQHVVWIALQLLAVLLILLVLPVDGTAFGCLLVVFVALAVGAAGLVMGGLARRSLVVWRRITTKAIGG